MAGRTSFFPISCVPIEGAAAYQTCLSVDVRILSGTLRSNCCRMSRDAS